MIPPEYSDSVGPAASAGTDLFAGLNPAQAQAVAHGAGPLLVLAGAGSGKTRVITHRIAHLILEVGVDPARIVAVTFTNKAAAEMRERVEGLLGSGGLGSWIGTFHAFCLRVLRRDGGRIGLTAGFNIYDTDDQLALVKRILKAETGDEAQGTPRSFLSRISRAKNSLIKPEEAAKAAHSPEARLQAEVYAHYEAALRQANVVDFDDLLVRTLALFNEHSDVAAAYSERCEHLLVDEYQDTNRPQYLLVRHLSARHGNICVVGDEDQSIYRFRGAEIKNILDFESDHSGTQTIRLEQNYRSSGTIIEAASAVIANNLYRKGKTLWTDNSRGEKIELMHSPDDRDEATWVARRVRELDPTHPFEDVAVLYRTNAQSRQLEEIFRRDRIPYQIVGSVQFYDRKEIKDLLAYLKLTANPSDDVAFRRVVNTPARGIGQTSQLLVDEVARGLALSALKAAGQALEQGLLGRSAKRLAEFLELIDELTRRSAEEPVSELLEFLTEALDYENYLEKAHPGQGGSRMENVASLISAANEYEEEVGDADLHGFLDRSALVAGADEVGERPGVTLMTIHCAKGLEFPVVFMVGLEENIFPHVMSSGSDEDLEEERRLCYVAMTRAKQRLFVGHARQRRLHGAPVPQRPSRFLDEIPPELIQEVSPSVGGYFDFNVRHPTRGYSGSGSSAARSTAGARARNTPPPRPTTPQKDPGDGFPVGALVLHPKFGGGQILGREGSGKNLKLTIHFSEHGPKKILPSYTKLQVETG